MEGSLARLRTTARPEEPLARPAVLTAVLLSNLCPFNQVAMSVFRKAIALAVAVGGVASAQAARPANDAIRIPHERYTLANGLTVVLAPDHSSPTVAVDVWYHVGSKNEVPGRTGFAHMFEHVMFTGSLNVPYGMHDRMTEGVGGNNNGSTNNDRTNYYESIPSNYLETSLWMEADRMGFLLDKLDSAKFVAQRDIVQNERRQGTENEPYERSYEIMTAAMYPPSNPYSWPVVGYMSELQQAQVDDVKNFFRLYYAPTNATLAVVGDFDPAQAKTWIAKYFAGLPKGQPVVRPTAEIPRMTSEKRLVFEDEVQLPRLYINWPSVGVKHNDSFALSVLARILTGSRTARLTKALVYDRQSAAQVDAYQSSAELLGDFLLEIVPRSGNTLASIEAATDSVLERLKREGPTAEEVQRATAPIEFGFVSGLQSNLGKAEQLLSGSVFHDNAAYYQTQYSKLRGVTPIDVKRVVNTYFGPGRVVLSIVPQGKIDQASKPESSTKVKVSPDGGHYIMGNK
jgi:zinc protease